MKRGIPVFILVIGLILGSFSPAWSVDNINVTYSQAMQGLTEYFTMRILPPMPQKAPCFLGQTEDSLVSLALIGHTNNLQKGILVFNLVYFTQEVGARNASISLQFLKNIVPKWEESEEWFETTLGKLFNANDSYNSEHIIQEGKTIGMAIDINAGLLTLTISQAKE